LSDPARPGSACASTLAQEGFDVTIFEGQKKPGGILRYGVPDFRLDGRFLDRRTEGRHRSGGKNQVQLALRGKGAIQGLLKKGFRAVFVAAGLSSPYKVNIPGST